MIIILWWYWLWYLTNDYDSFSVIFYSVVIINVAQNVFHLQINDYNKKLSATVITSYFNGVITIMQLDPTTVTSNLIFRAPSITQADKIFDWYGTAEFPYWNIW